MLEEFCGNAIVAAFAEVPRIYKVAAAEVDAEVQVCWADEAFVVEGDVAVEELVGGLGVGGVCCPAVEHLFGAKVY